MLRDKLKPRRATFKQNGKTLSLLDELLDIDLPVVIAGDFNAPTLNWDRLCLSGGAGLEAQLGDFCLTNGLAQMVRYPTRSMGHTANILDLVLTTSAEIVKDVQVVDPP